MNPETANPSPPSAVRARWLLYGLGAAVVAAGLVLPKLTAPEPVPPPDRAADFRPEGPEMGGMLLRLVGGTVFVLVLCVGTLWGCRRWLGPARAGATGGGRFEILESLPLSGRCRVHLVRVGERHMLAGMDATGLRALLPVEGAVPEVRSQKSEVKTTS